MYGTVAQVNKIRAYEIIMDYKLLDQNSESNNWMDVEHACGKSHAFPANVVYLKISPLKCLFFASLKCCLSQDPSFSKKIYNQITRKWNSINGQWL